VRLVDLVEVVPLAAEGSAGLDFAVVVPVVGPAGLIVHDLLVRSGFEISQGAS